MEQYIRKTYAGRISLWGAHTKVAAAIAKSAKVANSNMHSESVIKWMKKDEDFKAHCTNFPLYLNYSFLSHIKSDALFASQLSSLESAVYQRVARINDKKRKKLGQNQMSEDALLLQEEDVVESSWLRKHLHTRDEGKLKDSLHEVFVETGDDRLKKHAAPQHRLISQYASNHLNQNFLNNWPTKNVRGHSQKPCESDGVVHCLF